MVMLEFKLGSILISLFCFAWVYYYRIDYAEHQGTLYCVISHNFLQLSFIMQPGQHRVMSLCHFIIFIAVSFLVLVVLGHNVYLTARVIELESSVTTITKSLCSMSRWLQQHGGDELALQIDSLYGPTNVVKTGAAIHAISRLYILLCTPAMQEGESDVIVACFFDCSAGTEYHNINWQLRDVELLTRNHNLKSKKMKEV